MYTDRSAISSPFTFAFAFAQSALFHASRILPLPFPFPPVDVVYIRSCPLLTHSLPDPDKGADEPRSERFPFLGCKQDIAYQG